METVGSCNVLLKLDAGVPSVVGCDDSSVPTLRSMDNCWLLRNEFGKDIGETPAENEDAPESGGESRGKKVDNGEADEDSDEDDSGSDDSDDDSVEDDDMRDIFVDDDDDDDSEDDDDDDDSEDDDDDEDMDSEDEDSGSEDDD